MSGMITWPDSNDCSSKILPTTGAKRSLQLCLLLSITTTLTIHDKLSAFVHLASLWPGVSGESISSGVLSLSFSALFPEPFLGLFFPFPDDWLRFSCICSFGDSNLHNLAIKTHGISCLLQLNWFSISERSIYTIFVCCGIRFNWKLLLASDDGDSLPPFRGDELPDLLLRFLGELLPDLDLAITIGDES